MVVYLADFSELDTRIIWTIWLIIQNLKKIAIKSRDK